MVVQHDSITQSSKASDNSQADGNARTTKTLTSQTTPDPAKRALFENMLVLEIFAGTGNLTAAVRKANLRGVAIDRSHNRSKGAITILDLTLADDLKFLCDFIRENVSSLVLIHFAPPCGTCSAARKRKLPPEVRQALQSAGMPEPVPLRSAAFPMGLPELKGLDKYKVDQANKLYCATKQLALLALSLNIRISIENPTNSLFWVTKPMLELFEEFPGNFNVFHSCMMGGDRDKQTTWWCNDAFFESFNLPCSKDHDHKPWTPAVSSTGVHYPTSDEAAYPAVLCDRVVALIVQDLIQRGISPIHTFEEQVKHRRATAVNSVAMGLLPRGQKLRPLVSEFATYKQYAVLPFQDTMIILSNLPKGARIVTRKLLLWGEVRVSDSIHLDYMNMTPGNNDVKVELVPVGIPREPDDFVKEAAKVGHPRFLPYSFSSPIDELIKDNLFHEERNTESVRVEFFNRWLARAKELNKVSVSGRGEMEDYAKTVLAGKRLQLMGEILQSLDYPNVKLVDDIKSGFRLAGWMRDSNVFMSLPRPPTMSFESLLRTSQGLQKAIMKRVRASGESELNEAAWEETLKELDNGWIWSDDDPSLEGKIIAHRFGIRQGEKVRVIDNFKECGLNDTCGLPEKFVLHGVDYIASTLVRALALAQGIPKASLQGKTFDLTSAYKQFPVHPDDRRHLRIAILEPGGGPRLFGMNSLPFGATGSVAGFLRISAALFYILTVGLRIWCSAFFDDFPTISPSSVAFSSDQTVRLLFDMLGVRYAKEGKKDQPFSFQMKALGLIFDLQHFDKGKVYLRHTEDRKAELTRRLQQVLADNVLSAKDAESLKGRIQWFESYLFGRVANLAIHRIGKRALSKANTASLDAELKSSLQFLLERVQTGLPLELSAHTEHPILLFTDGAVEPGVGNCKQGTIGGIIYDHSGRPLKFFSEVLPERIMTWLHSEAENPIYLVEILAVYVALYLWGTENFGRYVVAYVDNEASRLALIKAYSSTKLGNVILSNFVSLEDKVQWKVWFGRVASHSNPSDAPSRLEISDLLRRSVCRNLVPWEMVISELGC